MQRGRLHVAKLCHARFFAETRPGSVLRFGRAMTYTGSNPIAPLSYFQIEAAERRGISADVATGYVGSVIGACPSLPKLPQCSYLCLFLSRLPHGWQQRHDGMLVVSRREVFKDPHQPVSPLAALLAAVSHGSSPAEAIPDWPATPAWRRTWILPTQFGDSLGS